jgi:DNA-binding CsgD family transcriptional regulator
MAAKSLDRLLAELRNVRTLRFRRAPHIADVGPAIVGLIAHCRTIAVEERSGGVAMRLQGTTESGAAFSMTCILHDIHGTPGLTITEREVAAHLCEGRTLAQIARLRGVSANTVKSQVRQIFRKLDVYSRVELVRRLCP